MSKFIDLTGKRFGKLTVLERAENNKDGRVVWKCQCDCGNITHVRSYCLLGKGRNGTKSCGCVSLERIRNLNKGKSLKKDITGQKFGKLTVIGFSHRDGTRVYWKCLCECGNEIITRGDGLKNGHTVSCGCYNKEMLKNSIHNIKHGHSGTRLHGIWFGMKERCYREECDQYPNYGARGITICPEWLGKHGAENFIKWAFENGYDEKADFGQCTIERIDNDKGYSPENCRWATAKEQGNNKRNNRYITYNGETKTLTQWCEYYGLCYNTVKRRIYRGWDIEDAFFRPIGENGRKKNK